MITICQPDPEVPPDRLLPWLTGVGAEFRVVDLWSAPLPTPDAVGAGLVVLGGRGNCRDETEYPWIPAMHALLRGAVEDKTPVLGICLGHQLLAEAFGGEVAVAHPAGLEEGAVEITWRPDAASDPVLGRLAALGPALVPQSHADAVVALPAGAVELARSARYPMQAFRLGSALGVQFHPEASPDLMHRWADKDPDVLREAMLRVDARVAATGRLIVSGFVEAVACR